MYRLVEVKEEETRDCNNSINTGPTCLLHLVRRSEKPVESILWEKHATCYFIL